MRDVPVLVAAPGGVPGGVAAIVPPRCGHTGGAAFVRAGVVPCPAARGRSLRAAASARPGHGKGEREAPSRPLQRGPFLNASVRQRRGGEQVPEELSLRSHSPLRRGKASCRLRDPRERPGRGAARRHKETHPGSIPVRAPRRGVPRV